MPEPLELTFGPFTGGLVNEREPQFLTRDEATIASNIRIQTGAIDGAPGHKGVASGAGLVTLARIAPTLIAYDYPAAVMADGASLYLARPNYRPMVVSLDGGNVAQQRSLGLAAPGNLAFKINEPIGVEAPGQAGRVQWAVTFVTADGVESNPFPATLTTIPHVFDGASTKITLPVAASAEAINRTIRRKVYRTELLAPSDALPEVVSYAFTVLENNTSEIWVMDTEGEASVKKWSTVAPSGAGWGTVYTLDTDNQIVWNVDGYPDLPSDTNRTISQQYVEDHSPPPALDLLANTVLARKRTGKPGNAGILLGVESGTNGRRFRWSMTGFPDYWPTSNYVDLASACRAIVVGPGAAFVFCDQDMYLTSDIADAELNLDQANVAHFIRPGAGKSAVWTPFGTIFLAREGLCLFDGSTTHLFSAGKLSRAYWDGLGTIHAAAYFQDHYYLFTAAGTVVCNIRNGLAEAVFSGQDSPVIVAAWVDSALWATDGTTVWEWGAATASQSPSKTSPGSTASTVNSITGASAGTYDLDLVVSEVASATNARTATKAMNATSTTLAGISDGATPGTYPLAVTVTPGALPADALVWMDGVSDQAGIWGVFAPGTQGYYPDIQPTAASDHHTRLTLALGQQTTLTRIEVYALPTGGFNDTYSSGAWPLVVFRGDQKLNNTYGDTITLGPGAWILDLYGQKNPGFVEGATIRCRVWFGDPAGAHNVEVTCIEGPNGTPQGNYQGAQPQAAPAIYRFAWAGQQEAEAAHAWNQTPVSIAAAPAGTLTFTPGATAPAQTGSDDVVVAAVVVTEPRYRYRWNGIDEAGDPHPWSSTQRTIVSGTAAGSLTFTPAASAPTSTPTPPDAPLRDPVTITLDDGKLLWARQTGRISDGRRVTLERARASWEGDISVSFVEDGIGKIIKTLSSPGKTEALFWLPTSASLRASGTRPSLFFTGLRNAATGKVGKLFGITFWGQRNGE